MKYRTLFFSDTHLGTANSKAEIFLHFFKNHEFEKIYAVGDIIDFWALKRKPQHWTQTHNDVIQKLLRSHRKGTEIIYVPGNHDEYMAQFVGLSFGGIQIKENDIHITAKGEKYLIMHGHELDAVMKYAKWLAYLGDIGYTWLLWLNKHFNGLRWLLGMKYWSLSKYLKHKVKSAVNFIGDFEKGVVGYAKEFDVLGVVCGHIHAADNRYIDGVHYLNCGDWVESCTAIVEHMDGTLELIEFHA